MALIQKPQPSSHDGERRTFFFVAGGRRQEIEREGYRTGRH